jgi:hypothetical protein
MPHVIERLFGHLCREAGMRVAESGGVLGIKKRIASTMSGPAGQKVKPVDF